MRKLLAVVALVLSGLTPASAQQQSDPEAWLAATADLRTALDRTGFDIEALALETVVEEPEGIADALDARVSTQIYRGVLRGGEGALAAGAGNAWDQALALSYLLGEAGYETRIARTRLDEGEIDRLLAEAAVAPKRAAAMDEGAALAAIDTMEAIIGDPTPLDPIRTLLTAGLPATETPEEATVQAARIAEALGEATPDGAALDAQLREEAADYIWVQARLSGLEDWRDLHVAYTPGTALEAEGFLSSPVPEEYLHRVQIWFELERREQGKLYTDDILPTQRFPLANWPRQPLTFSVVPGSGDPQASSFYYPLLNGTMPSGAKAFTNEGLTVDAQIVAQSMGMGALIATVGGKTSEITSAIGGLNVGGDDADVAASLPIEATALVLTVRYYPPEGGGAERETTVRRLVDRIGAAGRAADDLSTRPDARPLTGQWSMQIATGGIGAAEMLDTQLARVLETGGMPGEAPYNPAESATLHTLFQAASQGGAGGDALAYRAGPFMAVLSDENAGERRTMGIDILRTGLRVLIPNGDGWRAAPERAMQAGVAETLLEAALMDRSLAGFSAARAGSWATLSTATALQLATDKRAMAEMAAPEALAAATADLNRGALLAMAPDGTAWWRVDPLTGAALGIDSEGQGGEVAEYIALVDAAITSLIGLYGAVQCGDDLCCQATNVGWTILGFALIGGIGEAVVALKWMDDIFAAAMGISAGTQMGVAGINPLSGLCDD